MTRGDPAGAIHFKPFAQWELHDGAASDDSVKTEALHTPSGAPRPAAPTTALLCWRWAASPPATALTAAPGPHVCLAQARWTWSAAWTT